MDPVLVLALLLGAGAVGALVGGAVAGAPRRRLEAELRSARADLDALRDRVDRLDQDRARGEQGSPQGSPQGGAQGRHADQPEHGEGSDGYLITSLGDVPAEALEPRLTGREFVDVALGESLVTVAALAHGVRRAMSAESRHRIRFEVGREVKRARRQRRRDLKQARRDLRAEQLHADAADSSAESSADSSAASSAARAVDASTARTAGQDAAA